MPELKTQPGDGDVNRFLDEIEDEQKHADSVQLLQLMSRLTGCQPVLWGESIIGFDEYNYRTSDRKEHRWFRVGFSPRKRELTIYIMTGFDPHQKTLSRLGKYRTGKSCLYIKRLTDVDVAVLESLLSDSLAGYDNRRSDTGLIT